MIRLHRAALAVLTCFVALDCSRADGAESTIIIQDGVAAQVRTVAEPFTITIQLTGNTDARPSYYWRDFRGAALSASRSLVGNGRHVIDSPEEVPSYIELVFEPDRMNGRISGREPGEEYAVGFAVIPSTGKSRRQLPNPTGRFGLVHADFDAPYLAPWSKTLTWLTTGSQWWGREMKQRRSAGVIELPIIVDDAWLSDDSKRISERQLAQLAGRAEAYFAADPQTLFWETGIEENLSQRFRQPYYWTNLALKARALRSAADRSQPAIKLVYQVAELRGRDVDAFLASEAAAHYDVLSLHPYAWPDFPPPEQWLPDFLARVRQSMAGNDRTLPIWFTEVGAPVRGNAPGRFFGYPKKNAEVPGLTRQAAAINLVKMHVVALQGGVEKIFWYNYRDRGASRTRAEDHFGLVDYWGYPKPSYVAYVQLLETLADLPALGRLEIGEGLHAYRFGDRNRAVIVAWSEADSVNIRLDALTSSSPGVDKVRVIDAIGAPVTYTDDILRIAGEPVYIIAQ